VVLVVEEIKILQVVLIRVAVAVESMVLELFPHLLVLVVQE